MNFRLLFIAIFIVIFAISGTVSGLAWYRLRMDYVERNHLRWWHYYAFGNRAHQETMRGDPVLVRRFKMGLIIAMLSWVAVLCSHLLFKD